MAISLPFGYFCGPFHFCMSNISSGTDQSIIEVIRFFKRRFWPIAIVTLIAAVAAIIFSGPQFIKPKYKSTLIFYPTKNQSVSGGILEDATAKDADATEFGAEEQAEQALQFLSSSTLMDRVVKRFNLIEHYEIDMNGSTPYTNLAKEVAANIRPRRTPFLSIQIDVLDRDPQMAADIANGVGEILDSTMTEIKRQVGQKAFEIISREYQAKAMQVEALQKAVNELSSGMSAGETSYLNPFAPKKKGGQVDIAELKGKSGSNIGTLLSLTEALRLEVEQLANLKKKYERADADMKEYIPHKFIISPAFAAEKKSYPTRWLIVAISTLSTFFFSSLLLALWEQGTRYWKMAAEK